MVFCADSLLSVFPPVWVYAYVYDSDYESDGSGQSGLTERNSYHFVTYSEPEVIVLGWWQLKTSSGAETVTAASIVVVVVAAVVAVTAVPVSAVYDVFDSCSYIQQPASLLGIQKFRDYAFVSGLPLLQPVQQKIHVDEAVKLKLRMQVQKMTVNEDGPFQLQEFVLGLALVNVCLGIVMQ